MSKVFGDDFSTDKEETVREQILSIVDDAMTNVYNAMENDEKPDPREVAIIDQFVDDCIPLLSDEDDTILW